MKFKNLALVVAIMLPLAGCTGMESAGHRYFMRGQILEAAGNDIYLCIGSQDGARVGQELDVFKFTRVAAHPKPSNKRYKREHVGKVQIVSITDEHMATAKVISGSARKNDVVELAR